MKIVKGEGAGQPLAPPERLTNWPKWESVLRSARAALLSPRADRKKELERARKQVEAARSEAHEYKMKHWTRLEREISRDDPERDLIRYRDRIDKALRDLAT
ncbi:MAG: hypothetical protein KJ698_05400 [Actinobacteria bacterium]|nr:hypothetical protein [Actinomycetota bacterium]MBU1492925.1 hypothetical protein [Actinomycetota bacterium]MBU1866003.1 hypothetical protein [Actinomycetota bacterium]